MPMGPYIFQCLGMSVVIARGLYAVGLIIGIWCLEVLVKGVYAYIISAWLTGFARWWGFGASFVKQSLSLSLSLFSSVICFALVSRLARGRVVRSLNNLVVVVVVVVVVAATLRLFCSRVVQ